MLMMWVWDSDIVKAQGYTRTMADSDSSFTQILSDLDSTTSTDDFRGRGNETNPNKKIILELPEHLSSVVLPKECAHGGPQEENASTESSFVPVQAIGNMKLVASDTDTDWSLNSRHQAVDSSCNSSLISSFDLISLSGEIKRRCRKCSTINADNDCLCRTCQLALVANPCLDADHQVALRLQLQEEEVSFRRICYIETKRARVEEEPVDVQAQVLVNDIQTCVNSKLKFSVKQGIEVVPEPNLLELAVPFLNFTKQHQVKWRLLYHVSHQLASMALR